MAKYMVKHTCGCEVEHNLFGKTSYREWKIEKLQEEKCQICEKLNDGEFEIKEVHYSEYKNNEELEAVPNTYNKSTKTIKVFVKVEKVEEIVEESKTEEEVMVEIEKEIVEKAEDGKIVLTAKDAQEINTKMNEKCKKFGLNLGKVKELFNKMMVKFNAVSDTLNKVMVLTVKTIKKIFNKGEIMSRAWAIYRQAKANGLKMNFGECLSQSWAIAKNN